MHKLYDLKDMLCEELEEYGSKDKLDVGSLDVVDKLAHAVKNIDKIIEKCEEDEYSQRGSYNSYADGMMNRGRSYRMGRYSRARREGYSRSPEMVSELRELMMEAPDNTKHEFQKLIDKIESM